MVAVTSARRDSPSCDVVRIVRDLAWKQNAPELAGLAHRVALMLGVRASCTNQDPFGNIKRWISRLLANLEAGEAG